jgi:gamma-glutamylcyclotransferase (GGCT)/AIG2-like uncharacterized protein YtfP
MLSFAYGSNMSLEPMRQRCPGARLLGTATLRGYRFVIMTNGYASVVPDPSGVVHGILWRIRPRDLAALDAYEEVAEGLYSRDLLPVLSNGQTMMALVYLGMEKSEGAPREGYMELVVQAAREHRLPEDYIESLVRLAPGHLKSNSASGSGEWK